VVPVIRGALCITTVSRSLRMSHGDHDLFPCPHRQAAARCLFRLSSTPATPIEPCAKRKGQFVHFPLRNIDLSLDSSPQHTRVPLVTPGFP
jgi:hypothetical protein